MSTTQLKQHFRALIEAERGDWAFIEDTNGRMALWCKRYYVNGTFGERAWLVGSIESAIATIETYQTRRRAEIAKAREGGLYV